MVRNQLMSKIGVTDTEGFNTFRANPVKELLIKP
jgi:hypothetical protein